MTPLTSWVFLALLLGSTVCFTAHRPDDACVRICRAEKRSPGPEIRGVCNYKRLVLQSDVGQSAIQRLFRLCLTPCSDPGSPQDPLLFEGSRVCRGLRRSVIQFQGCSCNDLRDEKPGSFNYLDDSVWLDRLFEDYMKYITAGQHTEGQFPDVRKNLLAPRASGSAARDYDQDPSSVRYLVGMQEAMNVLRLDQIDGGSRQESRKIDTMAAIAEVLPPSGTDPTSSEDSIDWDMWCMAQCDNGQGGSACYCDIIP